MPANSACLNFSNCEAKIVLCLKPGIDLAADTFELMDQRKSYSGCRGSFASLPEWAGTGESESEAISKGWDLLFSDLLAYRKFRYPSESKAGIENDGPATRDSRRDFEDSLRRIMCMLDDRGPGLVEPCYDILQNLLKAKPLVFDRWSEFGDAIFSNLKDAEDKVKPRNCHPYGFLVRDFCERMPENVVDEVLVILKETNELVLNMVLFSKTPAE
jgi:hypothetical protein